MSRTYSLNGLRLQSELAMPGLPDWDGPAQAAADIVFRLGDVPSGLERPGHVAPVFQTRGDSEYLMLLPGTGRVLVRDGSDVAIALDPAAEPMAAASILMGPVQSVLWHQRGLLPLHASAVAIGGGAVALCGASGVGKSTLAAALSARGHELVADDICLVDTGRDGEAAVLPGGAPLRLWRDAIDRLALGSRQGNRAHPLKEKFFVEGGAPIRCRRRVLRAAVLLVRQQRGAAGLERLHGARAAGALHPVVHMRRPARALGRAPQIFAALTRLVPAGATVWRLTVPAGDTGLQEAAAALVAGLET